MPVLKHYSSLVFLSLALLCAEVSAQSGTFLTEEEFLQQAFNSSDFQQSVLWLDADLKQQAHKILGHDYNRLRVRYNYSQQRSAWVLEEIGKDRPITMGVVIEDNKIVDFKILVYRESRGGEIRHDFFTQQFKGVGLTLAGDSPSLTGEIDGITGATLSVRAAKKISTLALFFHRHVFHEQVFHRQEINKQVSNNQHF